MCIINPIWHGGDISIPLPLLDQILSADFFFQNFQTFWRWSLTSVRLFWHPAHWVLKKLPLGGSKYEHFSCFPMLCQTGFFVWFSLNSYFFAQTLNSFLFEDNLQSVQNYDYIIYIDQNHHPTTIHIWQFSSNIDFIPYIVMISRAFE